MSHVILKYPLDPATGGPDMSWQHAIPAGSRFLSLQVQRGIPCMWWSVPKSEIPWPDDMSDEAKTRRAAWPLRTFSVVPTGSSGYIDGRLTYMGTFLIIAEEFVGHLFCWDSDGI